MSYYNMQYYKNIIVVVATLTLIVTLSSTSSYCGQISTDAKPVSSDSSTPVYTYKIINTYPHSQESFTQGLVIDEGVLYEGTGVYRRSSLNKMNLKTGSVIKSTRLPDQFFGEGVTIYKDKIIQLTWMSGNGFVYDKKSLKLNNSFKYNTQGWGITHDGERLIMSDGTARLAFIDPVSFKKTGQVKVYDKGQPVANLNELEYIKGQVYANVWKTSNIAIIDPKTGQVKAWIDLEGLKDMAGGDNHEKTLNGIAYDVEAGRLFVTGKLWPAIYEIELVPLNNK